MQILPGTIETLEADISEIHTLMGDADFYRQEGDVIAAKQNQLKELETQLEQAYARWEELEEIAQG